MQTVVIVNIFSMFPLFFTIYLAKRHLSGSRQNWYYSLASVITLILLSLEILAALLKGKPGNAALSLHYLSMSTGYALTPIIPLVIIFYLGCSEWTTFKKGLLFVPMMLNILFSVLSMQSGWYFTILVTNEYQRGPYFWLVTAFSAYYYLWILIRLLHINKSRVIPSKILLGFVYTLPIASTAFQLVTRDEVFIFSTVAISLLLYYLIVQEAQFDYDAQTKVYNREAFEQELLSRQYQEKNSAIFMFDVNNLKQTNDVWGHQEGDSLLFAVARILTKIFEPEAKVFRIGGDEFAVILPISKKTDPQAYQQRFLDSLAEENAGRVHPISIAYGYAISSQEEGLPLPKAFILADEHMYSNKSEQRRMLRNQS